MRHRTDYEDVAYTLMPYFRFQASKILSKEYGIKQSAIASMLGITQAAVSKYLSDHVNIDAGIYVEGADRYVHNFIKSKMAGDEKAAQKSLCMLCQAYKKFACNLMVK